MKIICIGRNYGAHARELGNAVPEEPVFFLKPSTALLLPGSPIRLPAFSTDVQHELEVVFRVALGVPFAPAGAVIAVAAGALAPQDAPLWQIMIAVSFGTVIGELVFGGWGRNMLSAGVVTLASTTYVVSGAFNKSDMFPVMMIMGFLLYYVTRADKPAR